MSIDDEETKSQSTQWSDDAANSTKESDQKDEASSPRRTFENMPDIVTASTAEESGSSPSNDALNNSPKSKSPRSKEKRSRKKSIHEIYKQQSSEAEAVSKRIVSQLKEKYQKKVLPIEKRFYLHSFCLPTNGEIADAEFEARPMVLLLGQYSTGKTSFIRHLLGGQDFPGMHIGPEPTTDKFLALVHGDENGKLGDEDDESDDLPTGEEKNRDLLTGGKIVKGNTLTVTPELPFASLAQFGSAFLQNFEGSVSNSPLLHSINLIDTPGVLSGEKQRLSREYDFAQVARWFADRSDLILLLFDAHKLDISDELKQVVETIKPHNDDKIRCVLNKADSIDREELVRVYGSLMWSMGKIFHTPEVVRVYTGSYWDEPLVHDDYQNMFETDEWNLLNELVNLPAVSVERKVNALVKRIRLVKVHMCLLGFIRQQMPRWFGKEQARAKVLQRLPYVFNIVQNKYKLSRGDMPDVDEFRKCLEAFDDFSIFPTADWSKLQQLDDLIKIDIPEIMKGAGGVTGVLESSQSGGLATESKTRSTPRKRSTMEMDHEQAENEKGVAIEQLLKKSVLSGIPLLVMLGVFVVGTLVAVLFQLNRIAETTPEVYPH